MFSVPSRYPEAFGLYVIEALAAGTPVVLPKSGAFPEIVEDTGGGIIYEENNPSDLAIALDQILKDSEVSKKWDFSVVMLSWKSIPTKNWQHLWSIIFSPLQ